MGEKLVIFYIYNFFYLWLYWYQMYGNHKMNK